MTAVPHSTSAVTARFCGVRPKTTIDTHQVSCVVQDALTHSHTHTREHKYIGACFSQLYHARHGVSLLLHSPSLSLFFSLSSFSHTTNYFPSHDHPALSPHYQLIDRPQCFSSPLSLAGFVAAVSVYDSACRYHLFSFRNRNYLQVPLSLWRSKVHKITSAKRECTRARVCVCVCCQRGCVEETA